MTLKTLLEPWTRELCSRGPQGAFLVRTIQKPHLNEIIWGYYCPTSLFHDNDVLKKDQWLWEPTYCRDYLVDSINQRYQLFTRRFDQPVNLLIPVILIIALHFMHSHSISMHAYHFPIQKITHFVLLPITNRLISRHSYWTLESY